MTRLCTLLPLVLCLLPSTGPQPIGFIGDSITAQGTPHYTAARPLNCGVSGTTTADWLPNSQMHLLAPAMATMKAAHVQIVSVALGTNDARYNVTAPVYHQHIETLRAALRAA